jgi:hypothetical protein
MPVDPEPSPWRPRGTSQKPTLRERVEGGSGLGCVGVTAGDGEV